MLSGKDLRRVTLKDLRRCLKREKTAKRNRITAYKVFCSFLREELAILPRGDDFGGGQHVIHLGAVERSTCGLTAA